MQVRRQPLYRERIEGGPDDGPHAENGISDWLRAPATSCDVMGAWCLSVGHSPDGLPDALRDGSADAGPR
jgi:hypothetical protein